jgi:two-component system repressor protein LuxO
VVRNIVVLNDAQQVSLAMLPPALLQGSAPRDVVAADAPARVVAPPAPEVTPAFAPGPPPASPVPVAGPAAMVAIARREVVPLWQVERDAIEAAIARFDGNIPRAAAALEISPSTIYRKRQSWLEAEKVFGESA